MVGSTFLMVVMFSEICIRMKTMALAPERLTGMNPCISKQTCHECIQTPHCAWCAAPVNLIF